MNVFKALDRIFPCGAERRSGEVVSIQILVYVNRLTPALILNWKRKAWYVNASVNAFHMHRGLVRELSNAHLDLSDSVDRKVRRAIALIILNAYLLNYKENEQYSEYSINVRQEADSISNGVSSWWHASSADIREIVDCNGCNCTLTQLCENAVACL